MGRSTAEPRAAPAWSTGPSSPYDRWRPFANGSSGHVSTRQARTRHTSLSSFIATIRLPTGFLPTPWVPGSKCSASWARVERVAEAVAEEVERQRRDQDGEPRPDHQPRLHGVVVRPLGEQVAPTRRRLLDADAEEREPCLGEDECIKRWLTDLRRRRGYRDLMIQMDQRHPDRGPAAVVSVEGEGRGGAGTCA